MSEAKKIALTLVVMALMTFGVYVGFVQSSPTLTPGFGASGDWGCTGGEVVVVNPPPVITTPIILPVPVTVNPPVPIHTPAPSTGASGDWGCGTVL